MNDIIELNFKKIIDDLKNCKLSSEADSLKKCILKFEFLNNQIIDKEKYANIYEEVTQIFTTFPINDLIKALGRKTIASELTRKYSQILIDIDPDNYEYQMLALNSYGLHVKRFIKGHPDVNELEITVDKKRYDVEVGYVKCIEKIVELKPDDPVTHAYAAASYKTLADAYSAISSNAEKRTKYLLKGKEHCQQYNKLNAPTSNKP